MNDKDRFGSSDLTAFSFDENHQFPTLSPIKNTGMSLNIVVILAIWGNILSVVGIVICNKYITEKDGYNFMVFLSFLHFLFTTLGTKVMLQFGYFEYKSAPLSGVLPVAIGSLLSVAFMNLNLSTNSVGFYQV